MNADALILRQPGTDHGTFGALIAGGFRAFTGELPWRGNRPGVSCIPEGLYDVVWAPSPRFKRNTYRLVSVPGRAGILAHSANLMGDIALGLKAQLNGCIALGYKLGKLHGQSALLVSASAMREFEEYMGRKPFKLEIRNG